MIKLADTIKDMNSEDYKKRFRGEYNQLKIRYTGLMDMCKKWDRYELMFVPPCRRNTYELQLKAMGDYLAILEMRAAVEKIELDTDMPFSEETASVDKNRILMICNDVKNAPDILQGGYTVRELQMHRTACDRIAMGVKNMSEESKDISEPLNAKIPQEKPLIETSDKVVQGETEIRETDYTLLKRSAGPLKAKNMGYSSLHSEFFRCPFCNQQRLPKNSHYCPDCGQRVVTG